MEVGKHIPVAYKFDMVHGVVRKYTNLNVCFVPPNSKWVWIETNKGSGKRTRFTFGPYGSGADSYETFLECRQHTINRLNGMISTHMERIERCREKLAKVREQEAP